MSLLIASMLVLGAGDAHGRSLTQAIERARCGESFAVRWHASAGTTRDGWGAKHPVLDMCARFRDGAASFHTGLSEAIEFAIGP
jgi:hypothetical protein